MYCYSCGLKLDEEALDCPGCGVYVGHVLEHKHWTYRVSVMLSILLILVPYNGFFMRVLSAFGNYAIIFGILGLVLAFISREKFPIIMNIIAVAFWILVLVTPFFAEDAPSREEHMEIMESYTAESLGVTHGYELSKFNRLGA